MKYEENIVVESYRSIRSLLNTFFGFLWFTFFNKTSVKTYMAMVWLFCCTLGKSNDAFSAWISFRKKKVLFSKKDGILGRYSDEEFLVFLEKLNRDGYIVFPSALSREVCERILEATKLINALPRNMDGESSENTREQLIFNPNNLQAVRYDYDGSEIIKIPEVQDLIADQSILALAQEYLRAPPIMDVIGLWWHTNHSKGPDSNAAQLFHFDMDRLKWLKVFIYLTDVGQLNGPHVYVRGSHKSGAIPYKFLRRGYARLSDDEVLKKYGKKNVITFTGLAGTIIIEDTRGLHKGAHVEADPRLILQIQYSNSLFGLTKDEPRIFMPNNPTRKTNLMHQKYTELYHRCEKINKG